MNHFSVAASNVVRAVDFVGSESLERDGSTDVVVSSEVVDSVLLVSVVVEYVVVESVVVETVVGSLVLAAVVSAAVVEVRAVVATSAEPGTVDEQPAAISSAATHPATHTKTLRLIDLPSLTVLTRAVLTGTVLTRALLTRADRSSIAVIVPPVRGERAPV